ncbi:MAG: flagellar basal-body rod protein FlgG [Pseudomonadota bacterium]
MINALYIAESGLNSQQMLIDVISNNIANSNTTAFKKNRVSFVDLVYRDAMSAEIDNNNTTSNRMIGAGATAGSTSKVFTTGELKLTEHPLDIAISGNGFLEVLMPNGQTVYTRAGRLNVDTEGYLSTIDGHRLASNIQIAPDVEQIQIGSDGNVSGVLANSNETIQLGQIELSKFVNQEQLQALGTNLYQATEASGQAITDIPGENGMGNILQGYTEVSNVSMIEEMVNLVMAQRGYQLNARVIQVSDQVLETINNLRR